MQKPRICFVSQNIYPLLRQNSHSNFMGGAELQQLLIGKELVRRRYEVSFITKNHGQSEIEKVGPFKVISTFKPRDGIPVIRFFYPRLIKIWRALNKSDADVYYVRTANFILALVVLFAKLNKKKVIYCGANDPDFDPKKIVLPVKYRDKPMYFWGLRRCDAIVAQNKVQHKLLLENFNKNAQIIPNGFFKQNNEPRLNGKTIWVANFKKFKRPHVFIKLAKKIPNKQFVMIGGKSKEKTSERQKLYDHIVEKAMKVPNLDFKGFLPFNEVEKQFERAKLFINTSEHEGFPNTFLQAWSRGVPVISFVDPGDLIKKYHLGLVVKDFDEMVQKVKDVLDNKIEFSPQKIKAYFEQNLTIEKVVDKYEGLFNAISGRR